MTHTERLIQHARERAHERYGFPPTPEEYHAMVKEIETGEAPLLCSKGDDGEVFAVRCRSIIMAALYAPRIGAIATFLPARWAGIGTR